MAIGPIEMQGTIARTQDYTTIKYNEDNKSNVNQTHFQQQFTKEVKQQTKQVHDSQNADRQDKRFDAKDKGNGQYSGDGGRKRKEEQIPESGRVVLKGRSSFDIKI